MATQYNPQSVTNGLVYCVDAANPRSFNRNENLFTYSEQFNDASWTKQFGTITADAILAPDGTLTADRFVEDANNGEHSIYRAFVASNTTRTFSVYLKAGERFQVAITFSNFFNADARGYFNLQTGVATPSGNNADFTNISAAMVSVGNGWWRCSMTATKGAVNTAMNPTIMSWNGTTTSFASNTSTGFYVWGAQVETGGTMSPYTQVVASAVTRSTDWTDMIGGSSSVATNNPQFTNTNGGYFNMASASTQYFQHPVYSALDITNNLTLEAFVYVTTWNNVGGILTYGTDGAEQYALWTSGGSYFVFSTNWPGTWYQLYSGVAFPAGAWYHVVVTFTSGTANMYINGVLSNTTTALGVATLPAVASAYLTIGNNHPGGDEMFNGRVGLARVYNRVLSLQEVRLNFNANRGRYGI